MSNDALFAALAQSEALPSHAYRATQSALQIPGQAIEGLEQGLNARNALWQAKYGPQFAIAQKKSELMENFGKIASLIGPDKAIQLMGPTMESLGIDTSQLNSNPTSGSGGSSYTPEQLTNMGDYGKTVLGNQRTAQEISLANTPRDPVAYKSAIMQTGLITPEAFDAWAQSNMDQNGKIPAQNADYLEKSLGLKAAGNRAEFYHTQVGRNQLELLPSLQPATSAPGAAYQVKVAARQLKSLIANATTPQNLQLASVDLSRAVQRAAPVAETIGAGDYGHSLATLWSQLSQKITSDPDSTDVPLLRKQLYDTANELDRASTPWIQNHLQNMEDNGTNSSYGNRWSNVKNRELGLNIPDIQFNWGAANSPDLGGSSNNPNVSTGVPTNQGANSDPLGLFR